MIANLAEAVRRLTKLSTYIKIELARLNILELVENVSII